MILNQIMTLSYIVSHINIKLYTGTYMVLMFQLEYNTV